ncbi:MAG TPA: bifunctional precorrin-2 dehydrogenase/sirohydrochlorin ferrochelatase [Nitrospirales bacterium]|nr:bifunctional precorrin-2 dehydrogenase/sirohydrochlorin ferrochelatase [Nitrospira sp. MA-1]HBP86848.1 siroheme synthase [Nitrospiraceae bacterium]HNP61277.1 bifunctional precorrin-2 dehydrogenase/sirohydrochlorin ferrochelatase [Nitrospirales bacterium]
MTKNAGFQVTLDLDGRQCMVIGGDEEAVEKVHRLLDAGAKVTVVSPTLHVDLRKLTASGKIIHRGRTFRSGDAQGVVLIMNVLKDDLDLAKSLFELAKTERCLVWSMDLPEYSTIIMPALVKRGNLRIAISTSGTAPALAKVLRQNLELLFDDEFDQFLDWLGALREELKSTEVSDRRRRERLAEAVNGFQLTGEMEYPNSWKLSSEEQVEPVGKEGG